jgi:hypothetical protein
MFAMILLVSSCWLGLVYLAMSTCKGVWDTLRLMTKDHKTNTVIFRSRNFSHVSSLMSIDHKALRALGTFGDTVGT